MHEATRRLLGVLLRHLDGFDTNKRSVVIAATNRKEDLDPALLSRCAWPFSLSSSTMSALLTCLMLLYVWLYGRSTGWHIKSCQHLVSTARDW